MPRTKLQPSFMRPQSFIEKYDISKAQMSRILNDDDFSEAIIRLGEKTIRINEEMLIELMNKKWRWKWMCLRITTTKEVEKLNQKFKDKDDEIVRLKRENNELKQAIKSAYIILENYQVDGLCSSAYYRQIIRQIKEKLEDKVEKKFADEILPHYTSTNRQYI